jgi:copper chaperone NosL
MKRLAFALLLALAAGCDGDEKWPPDPSPIALGEEACAFCRMIVSDGRYAVESIARDGTVEYFDDLGCLAEARRGAPTDLAAIFVRDHATQTWVRGDAAVVIRSKELGSPMGFGLGAFSTRAAAEAEAARRGDARLITLEELLRGKS